MNIKPIEGKRWREQGRGRPSKHQYAANLASGCYRPCNRRPSYANPPSVFSFRSIPPSIPLPPSFPSLYRYNSTKPPIKAADRRSRNPRTERRITCEARRRGYVSVSKKPVDHLRGSVKLEIICPFPSTIPACLAIIGEHRRERAKAGRSLEKGQSERGQTERGREKEENREKEREGGRRIGGEEEFKEREKRRTERMKNREEEEEEEKRGKIS